MARALLPLAASVLAALALGTAAAEPVTETRLVPAGGLFERDLELLEGQQVAWRVSAEPAGASYVFDIHTHNESGEVEYLEAATIQGSRGGTFTAPRDGTYSWLVTNALARQTLNVTLATEVLAPEAPAKAPSWGLPALAGAGLIALLARRPPPGRPATAAAPA